MHVIINNHCWYLEMLKLESLNVKCNLIDNIANTPIRVT